MRERQKAARQATIAQAVNEFLNNDLLATASPAELEIRTNAKTQVEAEAKDGKGSGEEEGPGRLRNLTRTHFSSPILLSTRIDDS